MNTTPTPSIWNETYSTKYIPVQVCASPSLFVNMIPSGNDPLTSMTQSIRNKNKYAAKLKSQTEDPSLTWEDTYSDPTNCSPCYVNACPTPKITVNTVNGGGGGIGPNDNIATTGTIICGDLFVSTEPGKNGIFLTQVNNIPTLSITSELGNISSSACTLNTSSILLTNRDNNSETTNTVVNISGVDGTISTDGYIQLGMKVNNGPTNKNMGYCISSDIKLTGDKSDYMNISLDKISYDTSSGYDYTTIMGYIKTNSQNGIVLASVLDNVGNYNPMTIEQDGTYLINCSISIQQSNEYTSDFPPNIEFILGYYLDSAGFQISKIPSRMTLPHFTNKTIQYNYTSTMNIGYLNSGIGGIQTAIGGQIFAYIYQFEENEIPGIVINSGLSVNVIPSFVLTKLT